MILFVVNMEWHPTDEWPFCRVCKRWADQGHTASTKHATNVMWDQLGWAGMEPRVPGPERKAAAVTDLPPPPPPGLPRTTQDEPPPPPRPTAPAGAPVPSIDSRIAALEAALLKLVQLQGHLGAADVTPEAQELAEEVTEDHGWVDAELGVEEVQVEKDKEEGEVGKAEEI